MKHLSEFFDYERFFKDKVLLTSGHEEWRDYHDPSKVLGTKVGVVIYQDNTTYEQKDGQHTTNLFAPLTIKVKKFNMQIPPRTRVALVNPVCKIHGKYNENLSVVCDDLLVIPAKS